jgi:hypothetical protein
MLKKNIRCDAVALLLISLMLASSLTLLSSSIVYAQEETMTFTSGETIDFTSTEEMTFKSDKSMQFWSGETMKFGTGIRMRFIQQPGDLNPSLLEPCDWVQVIWPEGFTPEPCSWWEAIDPDTGALLGEFHVDGTDPPGIFHIDDVFPPQTPIPVPVGGEILAEKKIQIIEPCNYFEVHWPSHWWPQPCSWWEIIDPDTGELSGYEFHVDWTNESCEFHVDIVIPEPWGPWTYGAYEVEARRKIPGITPCDYFVVEEPPHWWPEPCTWWEIIDPYTLEPTGYNFHVDWTNESCEFHVDDIYPVPYVFEPYPVPYVIAEQKIQNITACDWFIIVDPQGFLPESCSWWEILDTGGAPTGLEFHVDTTDGLTMFHVDGTAPDIVITIPPSYTVTVVQKIDDIQQCDWFKVDDPALTPIPCSWWEVLDPVTGEPTGWEFHVDDSTPPYFHVETVYPGPAGIPPTYELTAERKIDGIQPCDWFKVIDPPGWVPDVCSYWEIIWPPEWEGVIFHVDQAGDGWFHIDIVDGGGQPPPPPVPPPWNVTARAYEPPPLPWYMKAPYPDYAPSGMPDFDQRQGGTYLWVDYMGQWSHCGPVAVANSLWWLDSEFEPNTTPPPMPIDNYPLVQAYGGPPWDDHDPLNVPPLVEHLAYLMDTDGLRTATPFKSGTNVFDMQAGITHYLSWSGVNPLGDVDGDGNVTPLDETAVLNAMGTAPGAPGWDLRADIFPVTLGYPPMADNVIDPNDLTLVQMNLGMKGQFYEHTIMAPWWWEDIVEEVMACQDVVLLIAAWSGDYRYDETAHFVTVAGLNASTLEIVLSDPILDNAEAGGYGDIPVPHVHPAEPPYITHNNASLVSHDAYHVTLDYPCPGGPLTIRDYPRIPQPFPEWCWQIEAAVITSPYAVHDVAVIDVTPWKTVVCQGLTMRINATVENQGNVIESNIEVTVKANDTVVDTKTISSLGPSAQTTLTFTWDASGFAKGNYTISAYATPVPGETDTADNTFPDGTVTVVFPGDITGDGKVDIDDVVFVALRFGSYPGHPKWDPNADVTDDDKVDIDDVVYVALRFGTWDP